MCVAATRGSLLLLVMILPLLAVAADWK